ncbi:MAG: large subunit ribosomal protein, partial [Rhodospirillaceae bacterium]|nr:large subunit ribosomal protein [Rhodospirillaceae bacterium]
MANKLKIRKGDRVKVISGRSKGKVGDVLRVLPTEQRVVVAGVNVIKRHTKPGRADAG